MRKSRNGSHRRTATPNEYENALVTTCCFLAYKYLDVCDSHPRAGRAFREAIHQLALRSDHPEAWIELASTLSSRPRKAMSHLRRALRLSPTHPQAHCELAKLSVALRLGKQKTRLHCEQVLRHARGSTIEWFLLYEVLEIANEIGETDLSRRILRTARRRYPRCSLFRGIVERGFVASARNRKP